MYCDPVSSETPVFLVRIPLCSSLTGSRPGCAFRLPLFPVRFPVPLLLYPISLRLQSGSWRQPEVLPF